jgi:thiol:disulfide interchange protein DsbA
MHAPQPCGRTVVAGSVLACAILRRCSAASGLLTKSLHLTDHGKNNKRQRKGELNMERKKASIRTFCLTIMLLILSATGLYAQGREMSFPQYGTGPIQVRIYTDYFCPPCRAMEPPVEPILKNLLKKKAIRLTLIDTPFNPKSPLYARYFLYALAKKNNVENALKVRNILFDAAAKKEFTTKEQIEELFKLNGIAYAAFDASPAFTRYNDLIKEDHIQSTPTCVIVRNGKKESFVGGPDIIAALKRLL